MSLQVDDVERQLTDPNGVAVAEDAIGRDGQRFCVELVGGGWCARRLHDLGKRQPVVLVLVAGDDQRQRGGVPLDEVEEDRRVVGRVDE